jgi:hypothetical protein
MSLLAGALITVAPALFYGREMRDHQRERQSEGIGHRNTLRASDLIPGWSPFRLGTILDWVGPVVVWFAGITYFIVT